jgi:hypothetical protein
MTAFFARLSLLALILWCGLADLSAAATGTIELTEQTVTLGAAQQSAEETVYAIAPFGWFYAGGFSAKAGTSVVEIYDTDGKSQQQYLFPAGNTIHALYSLDGGALWGLCQNPGKNPKGWRLTKFTFWGELVADIPLVFPPGFDLPAPQGNNTRIHLSPGLKASEVRGIYYTSGAKPILKTFTISTYGIVTDTNPAGFRDRDGFNLRLENQAAPDAPTPKLALAWKGGSLPLKSSFAFNLWDDLIVAQNSTDGTRGEAVLIAEKKPRAMWSTSLKFPLDNNGYTFYHYNPITRTMTLYPSLDALMGSGWKATNRKPAPKPPKR